MQIISVKYTKFFLTTSHQKNLEDQKVSRCLAVRLSGNVIERKMDSAIENDLITN